MSRFSNRAMWSVGALTTFLMIFGFHDEAAAQPRRLVLPSSNVRNLPGNPPAMPDAIASSPLVQTRPVSVRRSSKATRASIVALAAVGGFFGGGFAGALLENTLVPCKCD